LASSRLQGVHSNLSSEIILIFFISSGLAGQLASYGISILKQAKKRKLQRETGAATLHEFLGHLGILDMLLQLFPSLEN
jgi:hypothetical protein